MYYFLKKPYHTEKKIFLQVRRGMETSYDKIRFLEIKAAINECRQKAKEVRKSSTIDDRIVLIEKHLEYIEKGLEQYSELFQNAVQGVFISSIDGILIDCNPIFARMLGHESPEDVIGMTDFVSIHYYNPEDRVVMLQALKETGVLINKETQMKRKDGNSFWVLGNIRMIEKESENPLIAGIAIDISDRKEAEEKLRQSEEKHRRIVETAGEGFLLMDPLFQIIEVNKAYLKMTGYNREELLKKTPLDIADKQFKKFLIAHMDELLNQDYRILEGRIIRKDGRDIPVLIHGNTLRDSQKNIMGHVAFVADMSEQKKALSLAAEVQKILLPQKSPDIHGLDVAGKSIPCEEIGGDYFDYLFAPEYKQKPLSVVVGDLSGHGVDAALLMTTARAFLRMRASQSGTISSIVAEMNRHLTLDIFETGRFMTLLFMSFDPENSSISWVRAGHEPALLYNPETDLFEELKGPGMVLGIDEDMVFIENYYSGLSSGQIIAIGTDGIWETRNKSLEMFGKNRFKEILRHNAHQNANTILESVFEQVQEFSSGFKAEDDLTLVIVKIL
jgi:phosphoserine phosphatase RsbU/P